MSDHTPRVLLWGGKAVGKTTLLSVYLQDQPWLDLERCRSDDIYTREILAAKARIDRHLTPTPTSLAYEITVYTRDGRDIVFEDVVGEHTTDNWRPAESPSALLYLLDPRPEQASQSRRSIECALSLGLSEGIPCALAITKADQFLHAHDPAWEGPAGWWRELGLVGTLLRPILERFEDRVWPVSAFGFNGSRPAVVWSEFGDFLPCQVRGHRYASRPFDWLLREIGSLETP